MYKIIRIDHYYRPYAVLPFFLVERAGTAAYIININNKPKLILL